VEAIEAEERLFSTAMLFTGFLVVLANEITQQGLSRIFVAGFAFDDQSGNWRKLWL